MRKIKLLIVFLVILGIGSYVPGSQLVKANTPVSVGLLPQTPHFLPERILVGFKPGVSVATEMLRAKSDYQATAVSSIDSTNKTFTLRVSSGQEFVSSHKFGDNKDAIRFAHPDYLVYGTDLTAWPNDPYLAKQWYLAKVKVAAENGEGAWKYSQGNDNVKIIMLDSGIDSAHEDLQGKIEKIIYCPQPVGDNDPGSCQEDNNLGRDSSGHGTMVAGILSASTNNSRGIAGTAYNTKIISVKVLENDPDTGSAVGSLSTILRGLSWAKDYISSHPSQKFVINLSFATYDESAVNPLFVRPVAYDEMMNQLWDLGAMIIAASGNCGAGCLSSNGKNLMNPDAYPAVSAHVISVGAVDSNDNITFYSEKGAKVTLAAPGGSPDSTVDQVAFCNLNASHTNCIVAAQNGGDYKVAVGTSLATPIVSGIAALTWAARLAKYPSDAANTKIGKLISDSTNKNITGVAGGRVDGFSAVTAAINALPDNITPTTIPTPTVSAANNFCPAECPAGRPAKSEGNANCDNVIDETDYQYWQSQFNTNISLPDRTANFYCDPQKPDSQNVDLIDFEFWRRNIISFPGNH